jgi:hypothetical protein
MTTAVVFIFVIYTIYTILLLFILSMIFLKVKQKEKYTFWLWVLLCYVILLPILYMITLGAFSGTETIKGIESLIIK